MIKHVKGRLKWMQCFKITWAERSSELFLSHVVRRLSVHPPVYKLFAFSSSSEPLDQFQPNLAQSVRGWRKFKFVQMKGQLFSKGRSMWNSKKYWKYFNIFSSKTTRPNSTKFSTKHPWVKGIQNSPNEGSSPFPRGDNYKLVK